MIDDGHQRYSTGDKEGECRKNCKGCASELKNWAVQKNPALYGTKSGVLVDVVDVLSAKKNPFLHT